MSSENPSVLCCSLKTAKWRWVGSMWGCRIPQSVFGVWDHDRVLD